MTSDQVIRDRFRLKWIPVGLSSGQLDHYVRFLDMAEDEKSVFQRTVTGDEMELLLELETARAMYLDPVDREPGSITEAKVAKYPERYRWDVS